MESIVELLNQNMRPWLERKGSEGTQDLVRVMEGMLLESGRPLCIPFKEDNPFFPFHKIHLVDLSSAETDGTYQLFPPHQMLQILETGVDPSAIPEMRERSNRWMEESSSIWRAFGPCSFEEGHKNWLELANLWRRSVCGTDYVSPDRWYDMLGLLPRIAKKEFIPPKDLAKFPLLGDPQEAVAMVEAIGGEKEIAKVRKEIGRLARQKRGIQVMRTLCDHCGTYFDRKAIGGSGALCNKKECRNAGDRRKKMFKYYCEDYPDDPEAYLKALLKQGKTLK